MKSSSTTENHVGGIFYNVRNLSIWCFFAGPYLLRHVCCCRSSVVLPSEDAWKYVGSGSYIVLHVLAACNCLKRWVQRVYLHSACRVQACSAQLSWWEHPVQPLKPRERKTFCVTRWMQWKDVTWYSIGASGSVEDHMCQPDKACTFHMNALRCALVQSLWGCCQEINGVCVSVCHSVCVSQCWRPERLPLPLFTCTFCCHHFVLNIIITLSQCCAEPHKVEQTCTCSMLLSFWHLDMLTLAIGSFSFGLLKKTVLILSHDLHLCSGQGQKWFVNNAFLEIFPMTGEEAIHHHQSGPLWACG